MANITEYSTPQGDNVQPDEKATTAAREAAFAKNRFGREAGESIGRGISSFGPPLQKMAADAERHTTFAQIGHGAAAYSSLFGDLTQQWNKIATESDPNDTSVMQGFREKVLGPSLEKFQQGFEAATPEAQRWALGRSGSMQQHFTEKMIADMGTRAGIAVQQNMGDIERNYSNIVLDDPSALKHIVESLNTDVGAMIASSPTMTPAAAARVQGELVPKLTERIARTAAYSMANANPQGAINAINKGDFDKYMDGPEKLQAIKYAESVARAKRADETHEYEIAQLEKREKEAAAATGYVNKILTGEGVTAAQIAADPTLTAGQRENLVNFQNSHTQQLREKKESTPHPEQYRQLLDDLFAVAEANPNNLSVRPIREAFTNGLLNPREEAELEQRFNALDKPAERNFQNQVLNVRSTIKNSIEGKAIFDAEPERAVGIINRIEKDAHDKLDAERAKPSGGNVSPLLDPNDKQYIFSPKIIKSYLTSPKASIAAQADKVRAGAGPTASGRIAPAAGTVRDGYRFNGGDPAKPASWEKI